MGSVTSLTSSRPSLPLTVLTPATLASLLALQAPVSGPLYLLFLQPRTLVPGHPGLSAQMPSLQGAFLGHTT